MYVDDSGGSDETVTSEDVTVTVDGDDYQVEKNVDLDHDGHVDAAVVDNADDTRSLYIDDDADGDADSYVELDEHGDVLAEARFDPGSGSWIAVDPSHRDGTSTGEGGLTADMPQGRVEVGRPTIDTDDDGVNDTAVSDDGDGNTFYYTDADGDGEADYVVVVEADGSTVALEHTGDGRWEQLDAEATPTAGTDDTADGGVGSSVAAAVGVDDVFGVAKINPFTGQWMSPN